MERGGEKERKRKYQGALDIKNKNCPVEFLFQGHICAMMNDLQSRKEAALSTREQDFPL